MLRTVGRCAALLCVAAIASCSSSPVTLLGDARSSERLRRMNVVVEVENATDVWDAVEPESTPLEVHGWVVTHCESSVTADTPACATATGCGSRVCEALKDICIALTFRVMAQGADSVVLEGTPRHRVPQQDPESRVALWQVSQYAAMEAMEHASDGLLDSGLCPTGELEAAAPGATGTPPANNAEFLAEALVEALEVGEYAAEAGARAAIGVADRDRSGYSDLGAAARLSWFDRNLSRLIAAQFHVGGLDLAWTASNAYEFRAGEYVDDTTSAYYHQHLGSAADIGIGSQPPCIGDCLVAVSALRESGAPFATVIDVPIGMPVGPTPLATLIKDEVAPRLNAQIGVGTFDGSSVELFAADLGVRPGALRQAREWMQHEAVVFSRPVNVNIDPTNPISLAPNADGSLPASPTFDAATMSHPTPPPPWHFLAAAQATGLWQPVGPPPTVTSGAGAKDSLPRPPLRPERAYLFDYAHSVAREGLVRMTSVLPADASAQRILSTVIAMADAREATQTEVCVHPDTTAYTSEHIRIRLFGFDGMPATEDVVLVSGSNMLRCAVDGRIEGQDCTLTPAASWSWVSATGRTSRLGAVEWAYLPSAVAPYDPYLYVLRRRGDRSTGPGAYEVVAGIPLNGSAPSLGETLINPGDCATVPYDSESYESVLSAIRIDSDFAPEALCGDIDLNHPLPLEDEIIEDHDGFEDSWQHHLRVAAAAAAHADLLGQQLMQSGLEMDRLAEGNVDNIVQLCGAPVDTRALFADDGSLANLVVAPSMGTCTEEPMPTGCEEGYMCVGGNSCILSGLLGSPDSFDRDALMECLGIGPGNATVPVVSLGDSPLCYWYHPDSMERICPGAPLGTCPFPMPRTSAGYSGCGNPTELGFDMSMGHVMDVAANADHMLPEDTDGIEEVLNLYGDFDNEEDPPGGTPTVGIRPKWECGFLRVIRDTNDTTPESLDLRDRMLSELRRRDFFSYPNMRYWASRIGWRAYPLNYSEVTLDGVPWTNPATEGYIGGTGFPFAIAGDGGARAPYEGDGDGTGPWPCGTAYPYQGGFPGALFSETWDCSTIAGRRLANQRIGRAAVTLSTLTGVGLGQHMLPAFYQGHTMDLLATPSWSRVQDAGLNEWYLSGSGNFLGDDLSGWLVARVIPDPTVVVWSSQTAGGAIENHVSGDDVAVDHPFAFLSFGTRVTGDETARAEAIASVLWEGLGSGDRDVSGGGHDYAFFRNDSHILPGVAVDDFEGTVHSRNVFLRALLRLGDGDDHTYVRTRRTDGSFAQLSHLFGPRPWSITNSSGTAHYNIAHMMEDESGSTNGYGNDITRRDLLDAMELACQVAESVPEGDRPPDPTRPNVTSLNDIGNVRFFMEQTALQLDDLAQRQSVRNVPETVINQLRAQTSSGSQDAGAYGDAVIQLRQLLRTQAEAPRAIAAAMRSISTAIEIMRRDQQIFERDVAVQLLNLLARVIQSTVSCVNAATGTAGGGAAVCGLEASILAIEATITSLGVASLADGHLNNIAVFADAVMADLDLIDSQKIAMLNAADEVRRTLNEIRSSRRAAQSALAGALLGSSDASGRYFPANTAMRRAYDINLQRYADAHRAAVRAATVARMAVEQRFGVDLEAQTCAGFVDPPSVWAGDICNATGVNYGALRDPDAEVGPDVIRSMFVGDYVRRLEQYVESYRFDFPYSSGDDVMVMSLRDDIVRARSACTDSAINLLGSSNDLTVITLPLSNGEIDGSADPVAGWQPTGCASPDGCLAVRGAPGPRVVESGGSGPVLSVQDGTNVYAYDVVFAPGAPGVATPGYSDNARLVQPVVLAGGEYQLSWYQKGTAASPFVDARTDPAIANGTPAVVTSERPLADGWVRGFFNFAVPFVEGGTLYEIGVFPDPDAMVPTIVEQAVTVAGLQLTRETTEDPAIFVSTTAQATAVYPSCGALGDPRAFRDRWHYDCVNLCSGGFASPRCLEGEEPERFCFWEMPFNINEERLLGRGGGFGGGFAFGNYNYRSGEIAINVVGTGVRNCDGENATACYSTAGIPFSFVHTPPGYDGDEAAYTVRAHDGSLHPVHLQNGWIESARALAAERYLTNPVSSADLSLLQDYNRREFRGRPMTGTYRFILWETPSTAFHNIEDIQILWRYRYFTRTGEALSCPGG